MNNQNSSPLFDQICFGLNRETDERSLQDLLTRFSRPQLLATLIPRLSDRELTELADLVNKLVTSHLQHREYHQLFLEDLP